MGGKKKTKWRRIPLEEFTVKTPSEIKELPSSNTCQTDVTREGNNYIPSYNEPFETVQNYTEPYEYIDGLWYPTSCAVYNPPEVGLYSNYMMPLDNCYYYYTMPEVPQMQEYVPMPYQEYTPAVPKDTVYLLLPTQTLRPSHPAQNLYPEWQNRRWRGSTRLREGYADYAVIPEKQSSSEEKDHCKVTGSHSRRNSAQSNNFRKMTSFSETSNFDHYNSVSEQSPSCSKSNDMKNNHKSSTDMNYKKNSKSVDKEVDVSRKESAESNVKYKKSLEICGIHSRNTAENKELQTEKINAISTNFENEVHQESGQHTANKENKEMCSSESRNDISTSSQCGNSVSDSSKSLPVLTNKNNTKNNSEEQSDKIGDIPTNASSGNALTSYGFDQEMTAKTEGTPVKQKGDTSINNVKHSSATEDTSKSNVQSSLPDILSTLNRSSPNVKVKQSELSENMLPECVEVDKGINKPKSLLSQTSYLPNLLSSEALHNEMEMELKQLQNLHSLQANQSIYKLAYDENVTDQSEADSRSPSPIDPESQVPSSLTSAEIIIHEADSGSEAGSEDVELLPHRYESETFLNENKHVYVNKLSLAVELLRTQESLPYDEEFKRVVGENPLNNMMPTVHTGGKINMGFVEDSNSVNAFSIMKHFDKRTASSSSNMNDISQHQLKHSANSSNDSAIFSDIEFDSLEELCEPAKEAAAQSTEIQDNTEQIREGYRRYGIQARHYFSPRAALSLNPCFCCIIM